MYKSQANTLFLIPFYVFLTKSVSIATFTEATQDRILSSCPVQIRRCPSFELIKTTSYPPRRNYLYKSYTLHTARGCTERIFLSWLRCVLHTRLVRVIEWAYEVGSMERTYWSGQQAISVFASWIAAVPRFLWRWHWFWTVVWCCVPSLSFVLFGYFDMFLLAFRI